jgi:hypothetical protein
MVALETPAGGRFEGCDENSWVHHITRTPGRALESSEAATPLLERGLLAFREHGFWEIQQVAYERSVEHLREASRKEYEEAVAEAKKRRAKKDEIDEIERDKRADLAPPTWEALLRDNAEAFDSGGSEAPFGVVWRDGGQDRYLLVRMGNDVSCAAPDAWMFFQVAGPDLEVIDFGIDAAPSWIVERDGHHEVMADSPARVSRLDNGRLIPVAESAFESSLHCGWGQIPPVPTQPRSP